MTAFDARYEVLIWRATRRTRRLPSWAWSVRRCTGDDGKGTAWRSSGYTRTRRGAGRKVLRQINARETA